MLVNWQKYNGNTSVLNSTYLNYYTLIYSSIQCIWKTINPMLVFRKMLEYVDNSSILVHVICWPLANSKYSLLQYYLLFGLNNIYKHILNTIYILYIYTYLTVISYILYDFAFKNFNSIINLSKSIVPDSIQCQLILTNDIQKSEILVITCAVISLQFFFAWDSNWLHLAKHSCRFSWKMVLGI